MAMKSEMKISVAMTTYNGASYLRQQLDSIFAQDRLPDELIVCDDRSTDATADILREYAARAPFPMQVEFNEERLGSTKNFERAIGLCSGEVIALSDQDDVWRPHKLTVLEEAFVADAELGAVLTNAELIDENGKSLPGDLGSWGLLTPKRQQAVNSPRPYDLLLGLPVTTGATMAFRSRFNSLFLPIPSGCPTFIHDRWIFALIAAVARIAFVEEKLLAYRLHRRQQLGVGKLPLPLKILIPHRCWSDATALALINERLRGDTGLSPNVDFCRSLAERQRHIAARSNFSRNPFRRLGQVASELQSGRYGLYPYKYAIALQDLLVGTAAKPPGGSSQPAPPSDCAHDNESEGCAGHA